jgi:pyroglutamyl-peptidase
MNDKEDHPADGRRQGRVGTFMKILVTGFEPFNDHTANPSEAVVRRLATTSEHHIDTAVFPVNFSSVKRRYPALLKRLKPNLIINLGLCERSGTIQLEQIAQAYYIDPRKTKPTLNKLPGPPALETRLPVDQLLRKLQRQGIPATRSHYAGNFLCNFIYYLSLNWCGDSTKRNALFVHLPFDTQSAVDICRSKGQGAPSLPAEVLDSAVLSIIKGHCQSTKKPAAH